MLTRKNVVSAICISVTNIFLFACGDNYTVVDTVVDKNIKTVVEFKKPISAKTVFNLLQDKNSKNSEFIITVKYGNYQSRYLVKEDTPKVQLQKVLQSEKNKLQVLIKHFDPKKPMELPVYTELTQVLSYVIEKQDVTIINLAKKGEVSQRLRSYPYVKKIESVTLKQESKEVDSIGVKRHAITDWTNDVWYMPVAGTSTIWSTGTLQKFWFDESALNHYNYSIEFGIEMDTVIQPKYAVECNYGWSSNLPYAYQDTQFSDTKRNCSVGTVRADQLQPWTLYWTWRDFNIFYGGVNPHFDIQFQSNEWCWWIDNFSECDANRPWCMCTRSGDTIQWVISYYYNEAPGVELSWYRN